MVKYANDFYIDSENVVRWKSNDQVPFDDMLNTFSDANLIDSQNLVNSCYTRNIEAVRSLEEYVARRQATGYSVEEKVEMRNAFGDEEVVDIFTGKVIPL